MVCFRYIIVSALHNGDDVDDDDNYNNKLFVMCWHNTHKANYREVRERKENTQIQVKQNTHIKEGMKKLYLKIAA